MQKAAYDALGAVAGGGRGVRWEQWRCRAENSREKIVNSRGYSYREGKRGASKNGLKLLRICGGIGFDSGGGRISK